MIMYLKKIIKKDNKFTYVMTIKDVNDNKCDMFITQKDYNALVDLHKHYDVISSK